LIFGAFLMECVVIVCADNEQSSFEQLRGHAGSGLDTDAVMALVRGDA